MSSDLIKVSKGELQANENHTIRLEKQNLKLIYLRKKHIFQALRDATTQRIKTSKNIDNWITMLADKIFNPETIAEMDLNKAIALFKYVNNINLKVLSESNKLEQILGNYIESGAMETADNILNQKSDVDKDKLKHEIFSKLQNIIHRDSEDAEIAIVHTPENSLTDEEALELEEAEITLEQNLMAVDDVVELDTEIDLEDDYEDDE